MPTLGTYSVSEPYTGYYSHQNETVILNAGEELRSYFSASKTMLFLLPSKKVF
jgi:hypothetical protein